VFVIPHISFCIFDSLVFSPFLGLLFGFINSLDSNDSDNFQFMDKCEIDSF